jgi:hypothetical protein
MLANMTLLAGESLRPKVTDAAVVAARRFAQSAGWARWHTACEREFERLRASVKWQEGAQGREEQMATIGEKADYVRHQPQTRNHHCHWPGCDKQVPPAMWGCKAHWFRLPAHLRRLIWRTYQPGQEIDFSPSHEYIDAAQRVQEWIAAQR